VVEALEKALTSEQETLPVVTELGCLGLVRKAELAKRLAGGRSALMVKDVMTSDVPSLDGREPLSQALSPMQQARWEPLPVSRAGFPSRRRRQLSGYPGTPYLFLEIGKVSPDRERSYCFRKTTETLLAGMSTRRSMTKPCLVATSCTAASFLTPQAGFCERSH